MKENKILKNSLISSLFFVILVAIVFYFTFKKTAFKDIVLIFNNSNKLYIVIAIMCMACFSIFEALTLKIVFKSLGNKVKFSKCYKYSTASFFTASITPSATGGDPMALYLMSKDRLNISHSAIVLLTKLLIYQFVSICISIVSFICNYSLISNSIGEMKYLVYLGLILNILVFSLYFFTIFYKKVVLYLLEVLCKILKVFHYKKIDSLRDKLTMQIEEYSKAATILKNNKIIFFKIFITTILQLIFYYTIPYFVYLALGYSDTSILKFISIQSVLYISVSSLPFPGAVGVSEATFMKLYNNLFNPLVLGSAMFITRFINFYLFVIYTGVLLIIFVTRDNLKKSN